MSPEPPLVFGIPPEVVLHIFSYLDLPDLAVLAQASPVFAALASDPVLHINRLRITAPSRIQHSLFGASPQGIALRPTVGDLVHRGIIRGLNIERRWRMGTYFYSRNSVTQYETGLRLTRRHVSDVISVQLKQRSISINQTLNSLHLSHILPDIEYSSPRVSRTLLPIMHKLKWSIQRDKLSKMVQIGYCGIRNTDSAIGFGLWLEKNGYSIVGESERVRLAICPHIKRTINFYEGLTH